MKLTKPNIFKRIKVFFSTLRYIVSNYRKYQDNTAVMIREMKEEIETLKYRATFAEKTAIEAVKVIKERTQLSADISPSRRDLTYIFVSGRYRNRDYVKLFHVGGEDFKEIVRILREMEKYAGLKYVDAPYMMEGALKQEIERF